MMADSKFGDFSHRLVKVLPDHWVEKIADIVEFQASKYPPSKVVEYCKVNEKEYETVFDIGYYVCEDAFNEEQVRFRFTSFELT
jgi:hypothetical protein